MTYSCNVHLSGLIICSLYTHADTGYTQYVAFWNRYGTQRAHLGSNPAFSSAGNRIVQWEGRLTTNHLMTAFNIGRQQASRDINYYLTHYAPDGLVYEKV